MIGLTASGSAVKGNLQDGIGIGAAQNTIGPGNVISGNLRGINVFGTDTIGTLIEGNLIGTDITGELDLGNATEGILIQDAKNTTIEGNAQGSQVISGNQQGIVITGATASQNLIVGNLIGTDKTGLHARSNAEEGVAILSAQGNTIGGTTPAAQNLISANNWGVRLDGTVTTKTWSRETSSAPTSPASASGKRNQRRHHHHQCVEQHDRRNRLGRSATPLPSTLLQACPWCREPVIRSSPTASIPTAISESSWCPRRLRSLPDRTTFRIIRL